MLSSLPVVSEDDLSDNALNQSASGGRSGALAFRKSSQSDQMVVDEYVPHFMKFCPNIEHLYFLQVGIFIFKLRFTIFENFDLNLILC